VGWPKSTWVCLTARRIAEPTDLKLPPVSDVECGRDVIIVFRGLGDHFRQLNGYHDQLRWEIEAMVRPCWRTAAEVASRNRPIGIHVRRGDFATAQSAADFVTKGSLRTPLDWFTASLDRVRELIGHDTPAFVVSDGSPDELAELLRRPCITHAETGSAIGDLLALARSRFLIASGGSSFSAWAAFLGQMPAVTIPGQPLGWYNLRNDHGYFIGEFDPGTLPPRDLRHQLRTLSVYA
jgi:hypothetical protein